jgi:D-amino-acid dehydrogenase
MSGESSPAGGRHAVVVGAGIVGVACGLYLQRDGWSVTLLDRADPGEGTSKGNSGLLALSHVTPMALPGIIRDVPRMLLDPDAALAIRWRYLPRIAPWLGRFLLASRAAEVERICGALASLVLGALDAYGPLLELAGAGDLVHRRGLLLVYQTERSFAHARAEIELRQRFGVTVETLGADEIRQLVPDLAPVFSRGALYPEVGHVIDPFGLVQTLAEALKRAGGTIQRGEVRGFDFDARGVEAVRTAAGAHPADAVVIAAGAWSKPLARQLGVRVPLDTERGYNVTVADPGVAPRLPVVSADMRFGVTPMREGLRLGGTVEFAGLEAPPDPSRHALLMKHAKRLYPKLDVSQRTEWMGHRPSLPDSLPVIGPAPRYPNAYLAFGHGHIGLTTAAATGRAIADLAAGRPAAIDVDAFRADRFQ